MSYPIIRAMTTPEQNLMYSDAQGTKIKAIMVPQQIIVSCKCSGSLISNDAVISVPIDTINGNPSNVINGMTAYIGSSAGASDLGMVRVKAMSGSILTCARVSGINWDASIFITIVDDFGLWAKLPGFDLSTPVMDDNISYVDQNTNMYPIPILGPDRAIPYSAGSTILNGTNSYTMDGGSIITWDWSVTSGSSPIGSAVSGSGGNFHSGNLNNNFNGGAIFSFPAPGSYILQLTVFSSTGHTQTGHRNCYVYDDINPNGAFAPQINITMNDMTYDRKAGGHTVHIKTWEGIDLSTVRDRSKVILISDDFISGSAVNLGQVAGCEHTLMTGWISTEVDEYNRDTSTGTFDIAGPHYWLGKCTGPSTFLQNVTAVSDWLSFNNFTLDKAFYHFMMWRSTAMEVIDCYPSGNPRVIGGIAASIDSIWEQLKNTSETRFLTYMVCDRFGRFIPYQNPQLLKDRSSIPVVQNWTKDDFGDSVKLNRTVVAPVALLEVAGLSGGIDDVVANMYMSRAPGGLTYNRYGENDLNDNLIVIDQADANFLSGAMLAWKNNDYSSIGLSLAENNKMLDIAPAMYCTMTVSAADSIRGLVLNNLRVLINRIVYKVDEKGTISMELDVEGETIGIDGYTVYMPQEPISNLPSPTSPAQLTIPLIPLIPPGNMIGGWPDFGTKIPTIADCLSSRPPTGPYTVTFSPSFANPGDLPCIAWCDCTLRAPGVEPSILQLNMSSQYDNPNINIYAIDSGKNILANGAVAANIGGVFPIAFDNLVDTKIAGFMIVNNPTSSAGSSIWSSTAFSQILAGAYPDYPVGKTVTQWNNFSNSTGNIAVAMAWEMAATLSNGDFNPNPARHLYFAGDGPFTQHITLIDVMGGIRKNLTIQEMFNNPQGINQSMIYPWYSGIHPTYVGPYSGVVLDNLSPTNNYASWGAISLNWDTNTNHGQYISSFFGIITPIWFGTAPSDGWIDVSGKSSAINVC
jgi:hypothetical protein